MTIAVAVFVAGIATFFAFSIRNTQPQSVLPNPNGYDDVAAAAQWLVAWNGNLTAPIDEIRSAVSQNSKALETVRAGLGKQSAVPLRDDLNWFNQHMVQVRDHKSMAQLLVAEGLIYLHEGRTNEAARSFADCIVFAHTAHRGGLIIDELVGMACQALGAKHLVQVAPHVTPVMLGEILPDLMAVDQAREPAKAILQRDRDWSRGAYGLLRSTWSRIAARKTLLASETTFEKHHARSVALLRLVITDLAVRGYQAKNGKLPATLAELVPAWIPAIPLDPFGNRPLIYRVTTNSFLLYSVGPDGRDDQGAPFRRGQSETGDLLPTTL